MSISIEDGKERQEKLDLFSQDLKIEKWKTVSATQGLGHSKPEDKNIKQHLSNKNGYATRVSVLVIWTE